MTLGALAAALAVLWLVLGTALWVLAARVEAADRSVGRSARRAGANG